MMMPVVIMMVMLAVATVSAALRLKGSVHSYKLRSEALKHPLNHVIGPHAQSLVANFDW